MKNKLSAISLILLFTCYCLLPNVLQAQYSVLLSEDFEGCGVGTLPICNWNETGTGSPWTTVNGPCTIAGLYSLAVASDLNFCEYNVNAGTSDRIAYIQFSTSGFQQLDITFDWKCLGETGIDFGTVVYSNDGVSWNSVSPIQYQGSIGAQSEINLPIPAALDNDPTAFIGFRWVDNNNTSGFPGFVIDNISIQGEQMTPTSPNDPVILSSQCGGVTITRTGNPPSPSNVIWYWQGTSCGTNTSLGSDTAFTATTSGTFYIRAFNTLSGLWSSGCGSVTVTVYSLPVANAGSGGDECDLSFLCNATASVGTGTWTQVSGPGIATFSNQNSPSSIATVSSEGIYTFRWTEVNGTCSDFSEITVTFITIMAGAGSLADTVTTGDTLTFINGSVGAWWWIWDFGDGDSSTTQNPLHAYTSEGIYTVVLTVYNVSCSATDTLIITVILPNAICMIRVDSTSTKNVLIWDKENTSNIESYRVYRDIASVYTFIDSVSYSALSTYTDTSNGINPNTTSYRYKLSTIDTLGNESALSDHHKTIHLQINQGIPPAINLSWNDYEGFIFTYSRISRDDFATNNWQVIDSVGSGILSYTDATPPSDSARYRIEVMHPTGCTVSKASSYDFVPSNTASVLSLTGIDPLFISVNEVKIFPNPGTGVFDIVADFSTREDGLLKIFNMQGQLIMLKSFYDVVVINEKVDISQHYSGIYYLEITTNGNSFIGKLVLLKE